MAKGATSSDSSGAGGSSSAPQAVAGAGVSSSGVLSMAPAPARGGNYWEFSDRECNRKEEEQKDYFILPNI